MACRAIRGATTTPRNESAEILLDTTQLLTQMMERNGIKAEDIVSIFFSLTPDLDAVFPAVAARDMGLMDVPLLCLNEIPVPGALSQCIRILIHTNSHLSNADIEHVYLKEAVSLRPDHSRR